MTSTATAHTYGRRRRRSVAAALSVAMLAGMLTLAAPPASAQAEEPLPIVFVHGGAGSGAQYQAQAMRFASNGIPAERIKVFEYATGGSDGQSSEALDGFIDDVRNEFGVDQVHTAGHSLGTLVMGTYLSEPDQAAKVASYASLDGAPAVCDAGTNCTSITAASMGQTHVEAATSPESFARQYELFFGEPPATTDILPEDGPVEMAGRAVNFPANSGIEGGTVELWPLDPATGHRVGSTPMETTTLGANGDWGPWQVEPGQRYELALERPAPDDDATVHYYMQPLIRSDYIVRLNLSPADSALGENTNRGPDHMTSTVIRYREWWPNHASGDNDILAIFTKDSSGQVVEEPVSVLDNITNTGTIGVHVHDDTATPQETTQEILPFFSGQAFQSGVDVYMPAEPNAGGTVTFVNGARGMYDMADWQILNTPNWPSDEHHVILLFNDFVQQ